MDYTALLNSNGSTTSRRQTRLYLRVSTEMRTTQCSTPLTPGLYVGLIGPVGSGKTALCRHFAKDMKRPFNWVTFSDLVRPSNLIGSFDPTLVFKFGYAVRVVCAGPIHHSQRYRAGVFLAKRTESWRRICTNSLLDALEERKLYIPALKSWYQVDPEFYLIAAMNPSELRGTRRLPSA